MLPRGSKRLLVVALGAVGLVVIGAGIALILATRGHDPATRSEFTFSRSSDIAILELASGRIRLATRRQGRYLAVSSPTWSPDGRRLAFARQACPHCPFRIAFVRERGGRLTLISGPRKDLNEPSWSPVGDRLAVTSSEHTERSLAILDLRGRINPIDVEATGAAEDTGSEEETAEEETAEEETESPNDPAFSPDGRTLAFDAENSLEHTALFRFEFSGDKLHPVESEADHYAYPAFSPNGRRLAFSRTDAATKWDICVASLDGRKQVCLTHGPANDTGPTWSLDGRVIVFASDREDPKASLRSLYAVNADGSGLRRLTSGFDAAAPAFSPNGREVAFVRRQIVHVQR